MDVVVFIVGLGGSIGVDKIFMIDFWVVCNVVNYVKVVGIFKFVMVSFIGVDDFDVVELVIKLYLVVKYMVDEYLINSGLYYVIFWFGILLNELGMYLVWIDMLSNRDDVVILREDVVIVIVESVVRESNVDLIIYLFKGDILIFYIF